MTNPTLAEANPMTITGPMTTTGVAVGAAPRISQVADMEVKGATPKDMEVVEEINVFPHSQFLAWNADMAFLLDGSQTQGGNYGSDQGSGYGTGGGGAGGGTQWRSGSGGQSYDGDNTGFLIDHL